MAEERHSRVGTLVKDNATHYYVEEYDVWVEGSVTTELFVYDPEIFWGKTKAQVTAILEARKQPTANIEVIDEALDLLEEI
jgi:hypothetical protein